MTAAKQCKINGWTVGTKLYGFMPRWGDERGGVVTITAIGKSAVLLRRPRAMEFACQDLSTFKAGIEAEERYCEIAANRLRQGVLFPAKEAV